MTTTAAPDAAATPERRRPEDWSWREFCDDPFPYWALLRREFPVYHDPRSGYWTVTRYRDVVELFGDSERFSNVFYARTLGVVFGPTMLQMDGREHVVRRTIVAPEVVGRRLDGYKALIERNAREMLAAFRGRGHADLIGEYTTWLPVNVICDMLGLPKADMPLFHEWYQTMMAGLTHVDAERREAGVAAHRALAAYCEPIIAERMRAPGEDFISKVVHAEVDGHRMSMEEVQAFISLLLTAGGETTDKSIGNLWCNLLAAPDQLEAVRRDPSLWDHAFSETMRHSFPVLAQVRTALVDIELHGTTIPAGSLVQLSIGSANNDETVFADPRRFDLHRPDLWMAKELRKGYDDGARFGHLGFGLGKHFCLGYEMARAEAIIGSRLLLDTLPDLRLAPGFTPVMRVEGATRSAPELLVEFTPA
jgi:pulcherriminic acid synthase